MIRLARAIRIATLLAGLNAGAGCSSSNSEGQPNPDLKIPKVKPSTRQAGTGGLQPPSSDVLNKDKAAK